MHEGFLTTEAQRHIESELMNLFFPLSLCLRASVVFPFAKGKLPLASAKLVPYIARSF